jgi:Calcineurin-like phosphoesterase
VAQSKTILVLSDIHYASDAEKARRGHETRIIGNPFLRGAVKAYRHYIWRRDFFAHNHLLDEFLRRAGSPDLVVANGDYSCDTRFIGVCDDAACESVRLCLTRLRDRFGTGLHAVIGDHELGKMSLFGGQGGFRLASWDRATTELSLQPFWQTEIDRYVLIGVTSSLLALPVYEPETLPEERQFWFALRDTHRTAIRHAFAGLDPAQRVLLFCHDPTALPFLWEDEAVRAKLPQIEQTVIGHLHSPLILWKSRLLAGMPAIGFLGNSIRRMSQALHDARCWRAFKVRLCPALAGIELLKDGGYYRVELDPDAACPARFRFCPIPWNAPSQPGSGEESAGRDLH